MGVIEGYPWAQNREKLGRALDELREKNVEVTDSSVKKIYKRLLGFIIGEDKVEKVTVVLQDLSSKELYELAEKREKEEKEKAKSEGKKEEEEEKEEEKPKPKKKK